MSDICGLGLSLLEWSTLPYVDPVKSFQGRTLQLIFPIIHKAEKSFMTLTPIMSKTFFFFIVSKQVRGFVLRKSIICKLDPQLLDSCTIQRRNLTLPGNIRQGRKGLQRTNALAYCAKKKRFYNRRKDDREKTDKKKFDSFVDQLSSCEKSVKELSNKSLNDVEQKLKSFSKISEENSAQVFRLKMF